MKKILQSLLSVTLAMLMFCAQAMAYTTSASAINSNAELNAVANFDETEIYGAFDQVNDLVVAIENNSELTYTSLEASNSEMIANVGSTATIAMSSTSSDAPPFISAFLWGCIFNLAGMLIVGVTTGFDSEQMKKSAWGCLLNSLLFGSSQLYYY